MTIEPGTSLGLELCQTFGIPVDRVRSVLVICDAGEPVIIKIERFVDSGLKNSLMSVFETYKLEKKA